MDYIFYRAYHESNPDIEYIGSTGQKFNTRVYKHKYRCNNTNRKSKLYEYMRKFNEFTFEIIEIKKFDTEEERRSYENNLILSRNSQLNSRDEIFNYEKHLKSHRIRCKRYLEKNKERLEIKRQTSEFKKKKAESNKRYQENKNLLLKENL
jgi:hypothetical protein